MRSTRSRTSMGCIHSTSASSCLGSPAHVGATPVGVMRLLEEYDVPLEGARRGRRRAQRHRRQARSTASAARERDRHRLPLADDATSARSRARPTCSSSPSAGPRVIGPDDVREGATVIDVGMNRGDEGVVGDVDPACRRACGPDHARARRRRPDDDRDAPGERGAKRPNTAADSLRSRGAEG